jgi:hypothetical protein
MGHRQDMTRKQRLEWDSFAYSRKLEESKGHNYKYWTEDLENSQEAKGYDWYTFKDGKDYTSSELEAQNVVKELRGSKHYARIVCGMIQVVQKIKYFSITYKLK